MNLKRVLGCCHLSRFMINRINTETYYMQLEFSLVDTTFLICQMRAVMVKMIIRKIKHARCS